MKQAKLKPYPGHVAFGTNIRACRLGWHRSEKHGCFVRMSNFCGKILVELCPPDAVPIYKTPGGVHRCWWDSPEILDMLPWLRGVKRIKAYIAVEVGDDGSIVNPRAGEHT